MFENSEQVNNIVQARKLFYITPTHVQVSLSKGVLKIDLEGKRNYLVHKLRLPHSTLVLFSESDVMFVV